MTHSAKFPLSDELVASFGKQDKGTRFLKAVIKDERVELEKEINGTGAVGVDFNTLANIVEPTVPCYILFKEKSWGEKAWSFIAFIPDDAPVQARMTYGSAIQAIKESLGHQNFGTDKRYGEKSELTWENYKGFASATTAKPWSKRELAQQDLDRAESEARSQYSQDLPKAASGFHSVTFPFTDSLKQALGQFKSRSINWIQLALDDSQKNMTAKDTKTISGNLSSHVAKDEPYFYLYDVDGTNAVLVYCCPDAAPTKSRMVYSTGKAPLADQLKSEGIRLKKLDIRSADELTEAAIRQAIQSRSSGMFKPDANMFKSPSPITGRANESGGSYSSTGGRVFDKNQFDSSKPVFNRAGFANPADSEGHSNLPSKQPRTTANTPSAMRILTPGSSPRTTPKGVVLPPEGAYQ